MKKIIAIILSLAIILTISTSTLASAYEVNEISYVQEDSSSEEYVAKLWLCSDIDVFPFVGHCWVYVENLSDSPIQVGFYEVPVGQGVSVGSFSFSVSDGWGVYYNLEAMRENRDNTVKRAQTVSTMLDSAKLQKLTDSLVNYPNYWGPVANCSTFAFRIWNSVTGDLYFSLLIPAIAHFELILSGSKKGELEMYYPEDSQILRQRGTGNNAYLEPVSAKTLA